MLKKGSVPVKSYGITMIWNWLSTVTMTRWLVCASRMSLFLKMSPSPRPILSLKPMKLAPLPLP